MVRPLHVSGVTNGTWIRHEIEPERARATGRAKRTRGGKEISILLFIPYQFKVIKRFDYVNK